MDILRTPRSRPEAEPPVPLLPEERSKFKSVFERMVLTALEHIQVPGDGFQLSAVMQVMEAEEDGSFHNGYGHTITTEAGDWHLISAFFIMLQGDANQNKIYQLSCCGLGHLHNRFNEMVSQFGGETNSSHDIALASEMGRLIYGQIMDGARTLRSGCAEAAIELLLQHNRALANYSRFDAFLKVCGQDR